MTIEYVAGFFDGEGSIYISMRGSARSGQAVYRLSCAFANNSREVLEEIKRTIAIEGGGHFTEIKPRNNWKRSYRLVYGDSKALELIEKLLPHLFLKREQALIATTFQQARRRRGGIRKANVVDFEQGCRTQIQDLNGRYSNKISTIGR